MADYLYRLHGPYGFDGAKQVWAPEQTVLSLAGLIDAIEEDFRNWPDQTLALVIEVESLRNVTAEVQEILDRHANERDAEAAKAYVETGAADYRHAMRAAE